MHYIILHGTGCTPGDHWFPRLRKELEVKGHTVSVPALPHAEKPNRQERKDFVLAEYTFDAETVLIGHSSGATVILSILEALETPIAKAVLVSGFYTDLGGSDSAMLMLQDSYDREKIADNARDSILINSDNAPRGCTDIQARPVAEKIWAQFVLATWMGHMGSGTFDDPCEELPLVCSYL